MLEDFIEANNLKARVFEVSEEVHSAAKAAAVMEGDAEAVAKSIVLIDSNKEPLLVILLGKDKIDFAKIKALLGANDVRLAEPEEVLEITGEKSRSGVISGGSDNGINNACSISPVEARGNMHYRRGYGEPRHNFQEGRNYAHKHLRNQDIY